MLQRNIPKFGPLQGFRAIHLTQSIAGPYAACRLADFGADVIWIENPKGIDPVRTTRWQAEVERRNMRSICLDTTADDGRQVFLKLIESSDILIDSFRTGQMAKWGLSDEKLLELNPGLIIVHITGFGLDGDPEYFKRSGYDPVAQAFGCLMMQNGFPEIEEPLGATPMPTDYISGLLAAFSATAALYRRLKTGKGEVIDIAQFEAILSIQGAPVGKYLNEGILPVRSGNGSSQQVQGCFRCKDGKDIVIVPVGKEALSGALKILGLNWADDLKEGSYCADPESPTGKLLLAALSNFCAEREAFEAETILTAQKVPCSVVLDHESASNHPHYKARNTFIEYTSTTGETGYGINIFPRLKNEVPQMWRGLMNIGEDTSDILAELGYSDIDIAELAQKKVAYNMGKRTPWGF